MGGFGVGKLEVDDCRIWESLNAILNPGSSIKTKRYYLLTKPLVTKCRGVRVVFKFVFAYACLPQYIAKIRNITRLPSSLLEVR